MKVTIDCKADTLYLNLEDAPAARTEEISPGILLDYNEHGQVVGIEMLHLSKRTNPAGLARMQLENLEA